MSDGRERTTDPGSPIQWLGRVLRRSWNDLKSVYYANTLIWKVLKSAALVFLGLFCWIGANLLLSYRPDWWPLYYLLSYGFLVIFWGPWTHFVVVPLVIRMRRRGEPGLPRAIAHHATKTNLTIFLVLVVVLGTYPFGPMLFEFQLSTGGGSGGDVNPELQCTKSSEVIHCHLSDSRGVDSLAVISGGETVETVTESPFDFDVRIEDVPETRGQQEFTVELRDESGDTLRRYVRRVSLIPGESAA